MYWRALLAMALVLCSTEPAFGQPPAEHFARLPATQGISISPDGTRIAYIEHSGDERLVVVSNLATGRTRAADASHLRAFDTLWTDNDTFLARVGQAADLRGFRGEIDLAAFMTFDADTLEVDRLFQRKWSDGYNFNSSRMAGRERDSGRLLMPIAAEGALNLYAVDPEDGNRRTLRARGSWYTVDWGYEADSMRYARIQYDFVSGRFWVEVSDGDQWSLVYEEQQHLINTAVHGFTEDGRHLVISRYAETAPRTRVLQAVSVDDASLGDILFADDQFDLQFVMTDPHEGHVAGVMIERDVRRTIWFDQELADKQASLEAAFPGLVVTLQDWTPDRSRFLARVESSAQTPIYFMVDFENGDASAVRVAYPELAQTRLPSRSLIHYRARDGVMIPAYITLPDGSGPHPFIVMPHGGPAARDGAGFDYMASFLASRGYGVIQPQFRGSAGFGRPWETAGWGEWGLGVMQHDVTDAAAHLREQGHADTICIAGASYGGYAALAGAALTPEIFDCAIAVNAVSDLGLFLDYIRNTYVQSSPPIRYWVRSFTGQDEEWPQSDYLSARSPTDHADAITIPVLLLHGDSDTVVPIRQSRVMRGALRRANVDHVFVELDNGDHWLLEYQTRLRVLEEMEAFLARHVPVDVD